MKTNTMIKFFSLLFAPLLILACGVTSSSPTASPAEPTAPVAAVSGVCANQYFPVREGATWTYKMTGDAGESTYTDTITSVRSDGYTITSQFTDLTRTQEWSCLADGLSALQLGGGPSAGLTTSGSALELQTQDAQGVTFPKTIKVGDTWQHSINFTGTMSVASQNAEASGDSQVNFTALGMESVTVPAGTFNALKVQAETTTNINTTVQGISVPNSFVSSSTLWLVEGTGWVKMVTTGTYANVPFSDTTELQSVNIP